MIHPATFSYLREASVKGPAENDVVMLMIEEILQDGFVTSGDALLLIQSPSLSQGHQQASVGQGRMDL